MKVVNVLLLITLVGCSSMRKKEGYLATISNEDFKKVPAKKYVPEKDYYSEDMWEIELDDDVLTTETLAKQPPIKIKRMARVAKSKNLPDKISALAAFCHASQYDLATKRFDALYKKYKKNPAYWNQLGTCYLKQKKFEKALDFYQKAVTINAKYSPAHNNIGVIYQLEGDYEKAKLAYEQAANLNKSSLTPIFNLAQVLLRFGFTEKAIRYFRTLQKQNMRDIEVTGALGNAYLLAGDLNRAKEEFEKLNARAFEIPFIGLNYVMTLKLLGNNGRAKAIFLSIDTSQVNENRTYYTSIAKFLGVNSEIN